MLAPSSCIFERVSSSDFSSPRSGRGLVGSASGIFAHCGPLGVMHDRSLSSLARDGYHMARDEPCMNGDYCWPKECINGCVRTHSHLYSGIYGLVALLDYIQSSFSNIAIGTGYVPSAHYTIYSKRLYLYLMIKSLKNPYPLPTIPAHQPQHHNHPSLHIATFLPSSTVNMSNETF